MTKTLTKIETTVLTAAAQKGDAGYAKYLGVESRRVLTRTIQSLQANKLLYGATIEGRIEITPLGLNAIGYYDPR